jgi:hypothetical protein
VIGRRLLLLAGLLALVSCAAGTRANRHGAEGRRQKGGLAPVEGLTSAKVERALQPRRLALLVGINEFSDDRWPVLKHAVADARGLGELLTGPEKGRFDSVKILADPEGIRLDQVLAALDELKRQNTSSEDTVLVYFSTHGTLFRGPESKLARYLVTTDTRRKEIRKTALMVHDLLDRFDRLPSRRKVLVLAACHSGSGKSALPEQIDYELKGIKGAFFVRPLEEISQASMVLTACAWGETAREDDELGHDIYTHYFIEALTGEDADGDGAVTASEAHAHALARTYYYSKGRQRPQMESNVLGVDPIVLTGRRIYPADPVLFSFLPRMEGMRVKINGRDKGELPARLVLSPGSHRVQIVDGGDEGSGVAVLDRIVEFRPGDRLAVETLIERSRPHWHVSIRGGYQRFLDEEARRTWIGPAPIFGISVTRLSFPLQKLETGLDLSLGGGSQPLNIGGLSTHQGLLEIAYGAFMLYRIEADPLVILLGPRLAGMHLFRHGIGPKDNKEDQHFFNVSPGLMTQLRLRLASGLFLDLEARIHFLSVRTEKESLDLGYLDLFGGLGWSF